MKHRSGSAARDRFLRGCVAGSLASAASLTAHVAAGAATPSVLAFGLTLVTSVLVATGLAGRRLGTGRILVLATVAQTAFHVLFTIFPSGGVLVKGSSGDATAGHLHHHDPAAGLAALTSVPHAGGTPAWSAGPMLVWHVAAVVLITWMVRRGEDFLLGTTAAALTGVRVALSSTTGTPPVVGFGPQLVLAHCPVPCTGAPVRAPSARGPPRSV
ncbi:MAG: hypothetical protein CSA58_05735 [Micrococcales bacterium]|nr:MAG: hypothetical protein CSA58_05735 [Micrococcales bacterium]